jgi:hypothetical protein
MCPEARRLSLLPGLMWAVRYLVFGMTLVAWQRASGFSCFFQLLMAADAAVAAPTPVEGMVSRIDLPHLCALGPKQVVAARISAFLGGLGLVLPHMVTGLAVFQRSLMGCVRHFHSTVLRIFCLAFRVIHDYGIRDIKIVGLQPDQSENQQGAKA